MRLTKKNGDFYVSKNEQEDWANLSESNQKLGQLEDLMEKYGFETVEDLDNFIQSCINRIKYESKKERYL